MNRFQLASQLPDARSGLLPSALRGILVGFLIFLGVVFLGLAGTLVGYASIARELPAPDQLAQRAGAFRSTRIFDRDGNLLNETFDPTAGRRVVVSLESIPPSVQQATIATEDANFYRHGGVDPVALARAVYYAVREREFVSGASTIPQQLAKLIFLSPERTAQRKIQEAILAAEISRRYSKDQILEIYLNEIYFGNLAYGIDAAAETYFGKDVSELNLAESALLAGLPQAPAYYDPYAYPDRAKRRQGIVLGLMVEAGFISSQEADAAWGQPLAYVPLHFDFASPHFTLYVRQQLEDLLGPEALYQLGLNVTTTLDPRLQDEAQGIVRQQVLQLAPRNVSNGALVALQPQTGEILSMVGSADFDNVEIAGQVNMALAPRQPGSAVKPLVYLAALEQPDRPLEERWTPGTLIADIRAEFPSIPEPYVPTNYDNQEHGLVTVRSALANSYNIPAVRALHTVGIPALLEVAQRLGITTLTRTDQYGLSLALGAGEVPLLELAGAYAVLANGGVRQPPIAIARVEDGNGHVICALGTDVPCQPGGLINAGRQVVNPVDAFLLTDILRDNEARTPAFGPNSSLNLGRPAAAKTGTTNDYRDSLTVGYTPHLLVGVWVGNADNSPMDQVAGGSGAALIWNRFMQAALAGEPALDFAPPPGVQPFEVCADTGTRPSPACPGTQTIWFAEDRPPLPPERDLWQRVAIETSTGLLASEFTPAQQIEERVFKIYPPEYREWAIAHGIPQPPAETSDLFATEPQVAIGQPGEGASVQGLFTVVGTADVPAFAGYELQYGVSHDPGAFSAPFAGGGMPVQNDVLGQWDTQALANGPHTLRLVVRDTYGNEYDYRVRVTLANATPEPEPTPSLTPTWTPEPATPTPEVLILPPPTATPVEEPTITPENPPEVIPEPAPTLPPGDDSPLPTPGSQ